MNWLTITTTLIAAIAPSVVSIVTIYHQTKINKQNNEFQLRLKYLDYYVMQKDLAISSYLDCLFKYLDNQSQANLTNYQIAMSKVCIYVSEKSYNEIDKINYFIKNNNVNDVNIEILIDVLNKETQQYKY